MDRRVGGKKIIVIMLVCCFALGGCKGEGDFAPQAVDPTLDICHKCKMSIVDAAFVGQYIDESGQGYKFDDIGCMINYFKSDNDAEKNAKAIYIMGYDTGTWLKVKEAYFVKGTLNTPMSSGIVAVSITGEAQSLADRIHGEIYSWEEIKDVHGTKPMDPM
ncbi:MAG: nitrous oxide reductase accessory protein NosL [Peptococcaceae bacterium]|nr:nitrous oxide reductase accessory protein NosL [Peptococcaceae bacterium]